MVMRFFIINVFITVVLFAKCGLADYAGFEHFFEGAVNRRARNVGGVWSAGLDQSFGGKMPVRIKHLIKHRNAAKTHLAASFLQKTFKFVFFGIKIRTFV